MLTTHELSLLDDACSRIVDAFGTPPYLVGSAGDSSIWRDVDVRLILEDGEFDRLFPNEPAAARNTSARWELLSLALGDFLRKRTGLPADFQIQRRSEANELHAKPRNPLGLRAHVRAFAGGGDATPWTPPPAA